MQKKNPFSLKIPLLIITLGAVVLFLLYGGIQAAVENRWQLSYVEFAQEQVYAVSGCNKATEDLTIPAAYQQKPVGYILSGSFENMGIRTLTLEGSVHIRERAFRNCVMLTQVQLGQTQSIGDNAFEFCRSLGSITIPESVTAVGKRAFSFCEALREVYFLADPAQLGERIFEFCPEVVIYGTPGGNVEAYCAENGLEFRSIPEEIQTGAAN